MSWLRLFELFIIIAKILNALNLTEMSMFGAKMVQEKCLPRYGRLTKNGT